VGIHFTICKDYTRILYKIVKFWKVWFQNSIVILKFRNWEESSVKNLSNYSSRILLKGCYSALKCAPFCGECTIFFLVPPISFSWCDYSWNRFRISNLQGKLPSIIMSKLINLFTNSKKLDGSKNHKSWKCHMQNTLMYNQLQTWYLWWWYSSNTSHWCCCFS